MLIVVYVSSAMCLPRTYVVVGYAVLFSICVVFNSIHTPFSLEFPSIMLLYWKDKPSMTFLLEVCMQRQWDAIQVSWLQLWDVLIASLYH